MKKIDFDSADNQQIKRDFVNREVYFNLNSMVDYILKKGFEDPDAPFSYDDLNMERFSYNGSFMAFDEITRQQKDEAKDELEQLIEQINCSDEGVVEIIEEDGFDYLTAGVYSSDQIDRIQEEIEEIDDLEGKYVEVLEWWAVSDFLARQLEKRGEVIIDSECIWGRRTSGQAILLDWVITDICNELELLK